MTYLNSDFSTISPIAPWTVETNFDTYPGLISLDVTKPTSYPVDFLANTMEPVIAAPTLTPQILRKELFASVLPSWKIIANDLRTHPIVSLSLFLGVGFTAAMEPVPHFDQAILAIGSGTAIWMMVSGFHLARQALLEQSMAKFLDAKAEFGVGALSLLIVGATVAGLSFIETAEIFEPLRQTDNSNRTIKAISSLLHCGDEIAAGISIFKRFSSKKLHKTRP